MCTGDAHIVTDYIIFYHNSVISREPTLVLVSTSVLCECLMCT